MLVCIDHGNKQIKTTSRTFTSGLMESDTRPPFGDNIMFYNGKYYTLSDQRIPYIRDKTEDDRFFILTLFAIAYEINAAGRYAPDQLMDIQLAVGLPPAHYGTQYKRFAQYFLDRGMIGFEFNGKVYSICITEAICFPQALAATAPVTHDTGKVRMNYPLLFCVRRRIFPHRYSLTASLFLSMHNRCKRCAQSSPTFCIVKMPALHIASSIYHLHA